MLIKCLTPTFSDTELPPHEPQPSVSEGLSWKLYRSPIPPCDDGVFTRILHVFILFANVSILSFSVTALQYREDV